MFTIHYWVKNRGDGSVSVRFKESHARAEEADSAQDEGWGESFDTVWVPLEETK